jgi:hypothetical protein
MLAKSDDMLCALYRCQPEDLSEVRARMVIALARGHAYMPLSGECDNFDPASGCKGHKAAHHTPFVRYRYDG